MKATRPRYPGAEQGRPAGFSEATAVVPVAVVPARTLVGGLEPEAIDPLIARHLQAMEAYERAAERWVPMLAKSLAALDDFLAGPRGQDPKRVVGQATEVVSLVRQLEYARALAARSAREWVKLRADLVDRERASDEGDLAQRSDADLLRMVRGALGDG